MMAEWLQHGPDKLVISAFRGVGKSWVTAAYTCWLLLNDPQINIMVVSASKTRADDFSTFVLRLIHEVPVLQHLIPRDNQRSSKISFDVAPARANQSPSVKSVGITGQLTGSRADVIIADEPTASLDPERTFGLLRLLRHIADDGAAIMLITHDIGALMDTNVADQVSVIYASRLVESGKASFLLKGGAQHPYTRDLLAALPRNGLIRMPGILPELTNLDPDYTYTTRTMQTGVQRCAA